MSNNIAFRTYRFHFILQVFVLDSVFQISYILLGFG